MVGPVSHVGYPTIHFTAVIHRNLHVGRWATYLGCLALFSYGKPLFMCDLLSVLVRLTRSFKRLYRKLVRRQMIILRMRCSGLGVGMCGQIVKFSSVCMCGLRHGFRIS